MRDPELAAVLAAAGADLVDERPDVEIADRVLGVQTDAPCLIVSLGSSQPAGGARILRAGRRVARSLGVRVVARGVRAFVRRRGYERAAIIPWDIEQPVQLPRRGVHHRRLAELLPERVLVVASRGDDGRTLLEEIAKAAESAFGTPVRYRWPEARTGVLVTVGEAVVLRIAIGPASQRIHAQRRVLAMLAAADPPPVVRDRLPWPVEDGRVGLAEWSAEPRLHGEIVSGEVPPGLEWQCMDFLATLHQVDVRGPHRSLVDDARRCASVVSEIAHRRELIALGEELERTLAGVPRGFGHGDFWTRNLMCEDGRLVGVIDWDGGGPGRLPLLDLIHFQVSAVREGTHLPLGEALISSHLLAARQGGDPVTRAYCRAVGLDPDPRLLEALALAFWMDRNALELELRPDVVTPVWIRDNVMVVLDHLRREGRLPRVA